MYETVYIHGLTMQAEKMLRKAVELSIDAAKPLMWGDEVLLERLATQGTPKTRDLLRRIDGGYKEFYPEAVNIDGRHLLYAPEAYTTEQRQQAEKVLRLTKRSGEIEQELLRRTSLEDGDILVSFTKPKKKEVPYFPVLLRSGGWMNLFSIPTVTEAYKEDNKLSAFCVYAHPDHVGKARTAALEFLAEQP
jgi:HD superfamily phosphohydrolase